MEEIRMNQRDYRPLSFWSWNGEMESSEVREQIRQFAAQGYGGFFIHARAGLMIDYMQEEWFEACRVAIEEAKELGLSVWLYDEDGWPSGFAGGKVNGQGEAYQAKKLFFTDQYTEEEYKKEGRRFLSAYRRQEGGFVRCEPEDPEAVLFCGYELVEHYADVLCKEVVSRFIRVTHQVYYDRFKEYFGNVIRGIFTDEPQTMFPAWSPDVAALYKESHGTDILDELWMLHEECDDHRSFRYRYYETVSRLFVNNYTRQIHEWCEAHQISLTGHFAEEDGAYRQVRCSGGVMPNYRYMGIPGIDFLGNRYPSQVLLKQVSSVAAQTGKKQIMSESYGCAGWDITFREMMSLAAYQAVFGVNTICTHLSAYTIVGRRKRDYPAFYSYQEPWWERFSFVSNYIKRMNEILSGLRKFTHVALLHPARSIWCGAQISPDRESHDGAGEWESAEFRTLVELLNDLQIEFDLIEDDMLNEMECRDGKIQNEFVSYDILIVPHMSSICGKTCKYISEFGNQGGQVLVVDGMPERIEGRKAEKVFSCPVTVTYNTRNLLMKYFLVTQYQRECVLLDAKLHHPTRGLIISYGAEEEGRVCFAFNNSDGTIETTARQRGLWYPYLYDCARDRWTKLPYVQDEICTYTTVTLAPKESRMIRFCHRKREAAEITKIQKTYFPEEITVERRAENALTIDYASYRLDENEWSVPLPIVRLADEIHKQEKSGVDKLQIRYRFEAEYIPAVLTLAIENVNSVQVTVNRKEISPSADWWLDKKISRYDISGLAEKGENEVILTYLLEKKDCYTDLTKMFESERNRFAYKIEPENIYILGDFDVGIDKASKTTPCYHLLDGTTTFYLSEPVEKRTGDITPQGSWFYRGDADYSFSLDYEGTSRVSVLPREMRGTAFSLAVNGTEGGTHTGADPVDITELLIPGKNKVVITILGHNRNLLGPHHHQKHNPNFVGPSTFNGKKGFEDFVNPEFISDDTWTDQYSFIPFGCSGVEMIESVQG